MYAAAVEGCVVHKIGNVSDFHTATVAHRRMYQMQLP